MKDWTGDSNAVFRTLSASNHSDKDRQEHDYYATPPIAVEKLLEVESFDHYIWEPACGEGHISEVLKAHGYDVSSSDLIDRGYGDQYDFLKHDDYLYDEDIITNPPYKYALEFVDKALNSISEGQKVAMLLKLQFLETHDRAEFFKENPPRRVWVFADRIACAMNGNFESVTSTSGKFKSAQAYTWCVWIKGYKGPTELGWLFL